MTLNDYVALRQGARLSSQLTSATGGSNVSLANRDGAKSINDAQKASDAAAVAAVDIEQARDAWRAWPQWPEYAYLAANASSARDELWPATPATPPPPPLLVMRPDDNVMSAANVLRVGAVDELADDDEDASASSNKTATTTTTTKASSRNQLELECEASNAHYDLRALIKLFAPPSLLGSAAVNSSANLTLEASGGGGGGASSLVMLASERAMAASLFALGNASDAGWSLVYEQLVRPHKLASGVSQQPPSSLANRIEENPLTRSLRLPIDIYRKSSYESNID